MLTFRGMKPLFLVILMSLFGCIGSGCSKPDGAFKYYEYRSTTMRSYPYEYYRLEKTEENGVTLSWSKNSSDYTVIRVPEEAAAQVASLVSQYRLHDLKETYRTPFDVRDGTMWHVYITFENKSTSCSADNAWPPKRLWSGIEAINAYCNSLIEASVEADIIEIKPNR